MGGGGERAFCSLLAIHPIGPSRPGEGGEDDQGDSDNDSVALHRGALTSFCILRKAAAIAELWQKRDNAMTDYEDLDLEVRVVSLKIMLRQIEATTNAN